MTKEIPSSLLLIIVLLIAIVTTVYGTVFTLNSILFFPSILLLASVLFFVDLNLYFTLLIVAIFFAIRGELAGIPIQIWEIFALPMMLYSLRRNTPKLVRGIMIVFLALAAISLLSATMNHSLGNGLKNIARWIEYLLIFRGSLLLASHLAKKRKEVSLIQILFWPTLLLVAFSIFQSLVLVDTWNQVIGSDLGSFILGPEEAMSRSLRNNFNFDSSQGNFLRASAFYLSAVDLSVVFAIIFIYITFESKYKRLKTLMIPFILCGLTITLGRAAFLYSVFAIGITTLLRGRSLKHLMLCILPLSVVLAVGPARERLLALSDIGSAEGERLLIWQTGIAAWKSSPIYGIGGGNLATQFDTWASASWLVGKQTTSHSTYFGMLAELGLLGLAMWIALLIALMHISLANKNRQSPRPLSLFALTIFLTLMGINSDVHTAGNPGLVLFLLIFGFLSGNSLITNQTTFHQHTQIPS